MRLTSLLIISALLSFMSCKNNSGELPYLGNFVIEDGQKIYHKVGQIDHYNQDSILMTNEDFEDYIQVADFFFTSCPSICPKVMKEMHKIYEAVGKDPQIKLVSFTIDPKRDTPQTLKIYADNLGIDSNEWIFLSGDKEKTFDLANSYFVSALEDPEAPGGFDHSGKIILVDKNGHIRSFTEGTEPDGTAQFIEDIKKLSAAYKTQE